MLPNLNIGPMRPISLRLTACWLHVVLFLFHGAFRSSVGFSIRTISQASSLAHSQQSLREEAIWTCQHGAPCRLTVEALWAKTQTEISKLDHREQWMLTFWHHRTSISTEFTGQPSLGRVYPAFSPKPQAIRISINRTLNRINVSW